MKAGKLRHRVTLQKLADPGEQDEYGKTGSADDWRDVWSPPTRWAEVVEAGGREVFDSDQQRGEVTGTVTLRYCAEVTPAMRFLFETRTLSIEAVRHDQRKQETVADFREAR